MIHYRSTAAWLKDFEENASRVFPITNDIHELTPYEREIITPSIQDFQLGESSEGNTLRRNALAFGQKYGIKEYMPLMDLFIAEENRHSTYLARFMKQHHIERKRETFNDSIFRWLRGLIGIETSIRTLVTAEIIALTYYQCLAVATQSPLLKGICHHMLSEEETHVHFQMQHIQFVNLQKNGILQALSDNLHRVLIGGALLTVWIHHRHVLHKRFTMFSYFRQGMRDFNRILRNGKKLGQEMLENWKMEKEDGYVH